MPVSLDIATPTTTDNDGTPTGYTRVTGQASGAPTPGAPGGPDSGKVTGSSGADRATLTDVQQDNDGVIKLGAGDDLFVFGTNDTAVDLNGIVFMGENAGDADQVYLTHRIQDYIFTTRSEGGIKIQYIGEPDGRGDAITFYQAETFTFRNVDPDSGVNYTSQTFTQDNLYALIQMAENPSL